MKRPECLHIPALHEGEPATISWRASEAEANYILERYFNETFEEASTGFTWDALDNSDVSWSQYEQDFLNWDQIDTGTGMGMDWEHLDYQQLSWQQLDARSQTWQQTDSQETSFEIYRGQGAEIAINEPGGSALPGLSWEHMDAEWLTFEEWEKKNLTFQEVENQQFNGKYRGMTDFIPIGAKNADYRIKAFDAIGEESEYLKTGQLKVIPIFYRSSELQLSVKAGKRYHLLLKAQEINVIDKIRMTLNYNYYLLDLTNFASDGSTVISDCGNYPDESLNIFSFTPGKVWFQSTKLLEPNHCFSGPISLVEFIAKENGTAAISLT